jgi:F-type H+-transporting ATPase subunit epsilon
VSLSVHIVTPEREVWSGDATMVGARGTDGEVGILAGHAPLLVRLAIGVIRIQTAEGPLRAVVDGGFLHVTTQEGATRVDVLASHAELESEIDLEVARRRLEEAERHLQANDTETAKLEVAKALARTSLVG